MNRWAHVAAAAAAAVLAVGFFTDVADAGSTMSPLPCTGIPANANVGPNHGAGSTDCESTTPQPLSNADMNNRGANTTSASNPYRANGYGQVQGGHLAGTEGRADNKFPAGQAPNGTDANRGYECDQNPGIGNGNPAHTTCQLATATIPPPPPSGGTTTPPSSGGTVTPPPGGGTVTPPPSGGGTVTPPPSGGGTTVNSPPTGTVTPPVAVLPAVESQPSPTAPASLALTPTPGAVTEVPPAATATPARPPAQLAFTGLAELWLALLAMALIGLGFTLVRLDAAQG